MHEGKNCYMTCLSSFLVCMVKRFWLKVLMPILYPFLLGWQTAT